MTEAEVELFAYDARDDSSESVGRGTLKLDVQQPEKRVMLKNGKGGAAGDLFVE